MYWITGVLGMLFLIAPFAFGYSENPIQAGISLIIGMVVTFLSLLGGIVSEKKWEDVMITVFGLFAIAAPFLFGFFSHITATTVYIIGGMMIVGIGYAMYMQMLKQHP